VKTKSRFRTLLRRLRRDGKKGSAALEFAFVAPVFFVLLMGTMEAALIFFAQAMLQNAVTEVGRQVRTGQIQTAGLNQTQFRTEICDAIAPLLSCNTNLQVDVESFGTYGNVSFSPPLDANKQLDASLNNYDTGSPCSVVLVRAFYKWQLFTPGLSWFLINMAGDRHLLSAAAAFRNEPYTNNVTGC
jgi:Flp pilus assembly protein TadG